MKPSPQDNDGSWDDAFYDYGNKLPDCEQWPVCPQCNGSRIVRNGWLFCQECLYAEVIQK